MLLLSIPICHRIAEVERGLWRLPSPDAPAQAGLKPVAQDHMQSGLEHLLGWRLYNLSGQSVPVFNSHRSKKVLSYVQTEFHAFRFMCIPSCPVTEKSPAVFFTYSHQIFLSIFPLIALGIEASNDDAEITDFRDCIIIL